MLKFLILTGLFFCIGFVSLQGASPESIDQQTNLLKIYSVTVNGKLVSYAGGELKFSAESKNIALLFGSDTNGSWKPTRLRYKLEGWDTGWCNPDSAMFLNIQFYDADKKLIERKSFSSKGDSVGWTGSLKDSPLIHRRETFRVPRETVAWNVLITSAGPPDTVGVFVVNNLDISRLSLSNGPPEPILHPLSEELREGFADQSLKDWIRDGVQPNMAKIVKLGHGQMAFAIIDNDPNGHAEWRSRRENMPRITPGDELALEWDQMFSMGHGQEMSVTYRQLPPGIYRFCIEEVDIFGNPTGVNALRMIRVRLPFWEMPWFWIAILAVLMFMLVTANRFVVSRGMKRKILRLEQLHGFEQERLRIARDIHDDLGARITQISMLSAMAPDDSCFPQNARRDFDRILHISRGLVAALYETIWAVNPENDSLFAVGNYLCQMVSQLCESARLHCRFNIPTLPRDIHISSQLRHHIIMAVKESVHNVIKHANASMLTVDATFTDKQLTIVMRDNGCGFDPAAQTAGNGLINMKRRMEDLGGSCTIESRAGRGTCVSINLGLNTIKTESLSATPEGNITANRQ